MKVLINTILFFSIIFSPLVYADLLWYSIGRTSERHSCEGRERRKCDERIEEHKKKIAELEKELESKVEKTSNESE